MKLMARLTASRWARMAAVMGLVAGGMVLGPAPTATAATVCGDVVGSGRSSMIKDSSGKTIATIWFHQRTVAPTGCYVLQADMFRGTPHYMYLRVCDTVDPMSGCTGWDAGMYSYYAGPIFTDPICNDGVIKVHSPTGKVLFDKKVIGMPDICN